MSSSHPFCTGTKASAHDLRTREQIINGLHNFICTDFLFHFRSVVLVRRTCAAELGGSTK